MTDDFGAWSSGTLRSLEMAGSYTFKIHFLPRAFRSRILGSDANDERECLEATAATKERILQDAAAAFWPGWFRRGGSTTTGAAPRYTPGRPCASTFDRTHIDRECESFSSRDSLPRLLPTSCLVPSVPPSGHVYLFICEHGQIIRLHKFCPIECLLKIRFLKMSYI